MCGIIGYIGDNDPIPLIVEGLRFLEYRGYDSAGIAYLGESNSIEIFKSTGKLVNLENLLAKGIPARANSIGASELAGVAAGGAATATRPTPNVGIGHIRWATHGAPTDTNAHPHLSSKSEIVLVHNGIIENYFDLRKELMAEGIEFQSETDTECVVQLLEHMAENESDFIKIIQQALHKIRGAYALSIISKKHPDRLYAVRNHAPLVVGLGQNEFYTASDAVALINHTNQFIYLKDNEIAELTPQGVRVFDINGVEVEPKIEVLNVGPLQIDKKGYKHFMLKEIYEQPDVVRNSLQGRLLSADAPIVLSSREEDSEESIQELLSQTKRIVIIGCGTSFNAGLVGKYVIEELVRVPVEVESAGEFRYRNPVIDESTLVIVVSQSGETADTLAAMRLSAEHGAKILAVTNREDSTIGRAADIVLPVRAGVEVSVCATKSFTAQILVFYLLAISMAEHRKTYEADQIEHLKTELFKMPALIEAALSDTAPIQALAKKYGHARDVLFIARGVNYPVALEGALKLKEISYIHAEGYSGAELKHGPIAMLDDSIPIFSVLVPGTVFDKIISNCQEAKARDAQMVGVTSAQMNEELSKTFDDTLSIPFSSELLSPLVTTVPLQLLSYYMAEHLGKDVDQPRNLAKSVTVE